MKLYFVRHASASDAAERDEDREITPQGEEEARIVGRALAKLDAKPTHIFASPFLRARQTASIIAETGNCLKPVAIDELKNGATTDALLHVLPRVPEILLVGHMPSLAEHLAALSGEDAGKLAMAKASIAGVELPDLRTGAGKLLWTKRQAQLRALL
jgi:phosphohistidine phosphatase